MFAQLQRREVKQDIFVNIISASLFLLRQGSVLKVGPLYIPCHEEEQDFLPAYRLDMEKVDIEKMALMIRSQLSDIVCCLNLSIYAVATSIY